MTPQGSVANVTVKVSSGYDSLDDASITCVKTWTYRPATRNGAPVVSHKVSAITWKIEDQGTAANATPGANWYFADSHIVPPPPKPADWSAELMVGTVAAYKFENGFAPAQRLWAFIEPQFVTKPSRYADLDDFVTKYGPQVEAGPNFSLDHEKRTTVCGNSPAWEIEYSRSGLDLSHSNMVMKVDLVAVVVNGLAFIATYVRAADDPERPEAVQWIHSYCPPSAISLAH